MQKGYTISFKGLDGEINTIMTNSERKAEIINFGLNKTGYKTETHCYNQRFAYPYAIENYKGFFAIAERNEPVSYRPSYNYWAWTFYIEGAMLIRTILADCGIETDVVMTQRLS